MHLIPFPKHGKRHLTRLSTLNSQAAPCVIISVDTGRLRSTQDANAQQKHHRAAASLHSLCGELELSVTWGICEPLMSPLVDRICATPEAGWGNEIALRLDCYLLSSRSRRKLLADGLARCRRQAESRGLEVVTLFADPPLLAGNHDLLVRRGITSVRHLAGGEPGGNHASGVPGALRYGLWQYPVTHTLPQGRPLALRRTGSLFAHRSRMYSNWSPGAVHVAIEAADLAGGDRWTWRSVEKSLRVVARMQSEGALRVETMRAVTARLASVPAAAPQRSILREAA